MEAHPGDHDDLFASAVLRWPTAIANLDEKREVAHRAAAMVADGQTIGIGSGSAAYLVLWAIGERVKRDGLAIRVVTSSYETQTAALAHGIELLPLGSVEPDWGVDGADEVDPDGRLLKGRGGAMFHEKILWSTAKRMYLAIDPTKYVERLGQGFPLPIEVDRHGVDLLDRSLSTLGAVSQQLRVAAGKDGPVITESGNLIVDARFDEIAHGLHAELKRLPGVIETGLFEGYSYEIL